MSHPVSIAPALLGLPVVVRRTTRSATHDGDGRQGTIAAIHWPKPDRHSAPTVQFLVLIPDCGFVVARHDEVQPEIALPGDIPAEFVPTPEVPWPGVHINQGARMPAFPLSGQRGDKP